MPDDVAEEPDDPDIPEDGPAPPAPGNDLSERSHRAALVVTAAVLLLVVVALPFALRSMAGTLFLGSRKRSSTTSARIASCRPW